MYISRIRRPTKPTLSRVHQAHPSRLSTTTTIPSLRVKKNFIVAVADVILVTVIATLAAFLYNLAAALLGGLEVVLAEEDR